MAGVRIFKGLCSSLGERCVCPKRSKTARYNTVARRRLERPIFLVRLRPEKDIDGVRSLRLALKFLLRRFHLRCVTASAFSERLFASKTGASDDRDHPAVSAISCPRGAGSRRRLVLCRGRGWLHGNRDQALADARWIAAGYGVRVLAHPEVGVP
jgi:hypothetical protein